MRKRAGIVFSSTTGNDKKYTACGYFSLNLRLFASVFSDIVLYIIIMVRIK